MVFGGSLYASAAVCTEGAESEVGVLTDMEMDPASLMARAEQGISVAQVIQMVKMYRSQRYGRQCLLRLFAFLLPFQLFPFPHRQRYRRRADQAQALAQKHQQENYDLKTKLDRLYDDNAQLQHRIK